jgi:hypothetical protein
MLVPLDDRSHIVSCEKVCEELPRWGLRDCKCFTDDGEKLYLKQLFLSWLIGPQLAFSIIG